MKKFFATIILILIIMNSVFAQNLEESELKEDLTYQLLIQKGMKLEKAGEFDEAYSCYEEAYERSNNIEPLLRIATLYTEIGIYDKAIERLKEIPKDKLPVIGQSEVSYYLGKAYSAKGKYNDAAKEYINTLQLTPKKGSAKARLALINLMNGMDKRSEELLSDEIFDAENGYEYEDYKICFAVDMYNANFFRAYDLCESISSINAKANPELGTFDKILNYPIIIFFNFLPLLLSKTLLIAYLFILFTALSVSAILLSKNTKWWHLFIFCIGGIALILISNISCIKDVYISILNDKYYLFDKAWIIPKMIIASHIITYALFLIFPCFLILKDNLKPTSYELFSIWFFCYFFGIFVLSFQSGNINLLTRLIYLAISMIFSIMVATTMPLGKLLFFKLSQVKGLAFIGKLININNTESNSSFTDIKILENKIWIHLNNGEINSALAIVKGILTKSNRKDYPSLWLGYIASLVFNDEYEDATQNIEDFYKVFKGKKQFESCLVYEAYLKSEKGDFATAYKLINSISAQRANSMTADESAISLLILAKCCIDGKAIEQAHINLEKALNCAKSNYLKILILTEITELEVTNNELQSLQKWKEISSTINGKDKCISFQNTIQSMIAFSEGKAEDALVLAAKSLKDSSTNSKAIYWFGHLLCLRGRFNDAENLLAHMKSGSYNAERLMTEVTATHSNK